MFLGLLGEKSSQMLVTFYLNYFELYFNLAVLRLQLSFQFSLSATFLKAIINILVVP